MSGSHRTPSRSRAPFSRRGKVIAAGATVTVVLVGTLGYFALFPKKAPAFVRTAIDKVGLGDVAPPPPPPVCPLTGVEAPDGEIPARPALAVKVENLPDARPQAGLQAADLVYEEPVEGGITRFIVVYHCDDVGRVGPVRSARTTDPDVLMQFADPILAYSGGAPNVVNAVASAPVVALDESDGGDAFTRDAAFVSPHNLFGDTKTLYRTARAGREAPAAVFAYAPEFEGRSRRAASIHLPFSPTYSDVNWAWSRKARAWVRSHATVPHVDESGERVSAANVVVQVVEVVIGPRGGISPHVELTGSGRAYVFRDGRMIVGRWERDSLRDVTRFVAKDGTEIPLAPGRTWVELFPSSISLDFAAGAGQE
ncbi:MAG: DUF3048 domain-containing protein [Actinomycetota bacterium]